MSGLGNPTKCGKIGYWAEISQVELSKDNSVWILFVLGG